MFYSEAWQPEYMGPASVENYIIIGGSEELTSLLSAFRTMIAFKHNEIFVCEGSNPEEMIINPTPARHGCAAPFSPAIHKMPIFASWDALYAFDGRQEQKIIEYTDPIFESEINRSYIHRSIGTVWRDMYFFSYPETGQTYPNKTLIIDLNHQNHAYHYNSGFTQFCTDSEGNLWGGDSSGWLYKIEQPTNTDSETVTTSYKSKKFALSEVRNQPGPIREIYFRANTGGVNATLKVYLDGVLIQTYTFNASSLTPFRVKTPARFGRYVEIQFDYASTGTFRVVPPLFVNPPEGFTNG
jgi:hypothetical protein